MEDLRELYDHSDYGEAYIGMAKHVSEMSSLDRIIFEDCDLSAGKVVAPHLNYNSHPYYLCPEYVAKRIGCSLRDAATLVDCWSILDATQEMVETFISWVKARWIEKGISYFERLAKAAAEAEAIDPEDVTEDPEPYGDVPDTYSYHVIGEYPEDDNTPWIEKQPRWFRKLIEKVKKCNKLDELTKIGKEVYQSKLSRDQAGVFWTEYNLKKSQLEQSITLSPTASVFIRKIAGSNGNLASLGAYLYKVQQGKIKVANPPSKHEWTIIWKAYQERKEVHGDV